MSEVKKQADEAKRSLDDIADILASSESQSEWCEAFSVACDQLRGSLDRIAALRGASQAAPASSQGSGEECS